MCPGGGEHSGRHTPIVRAALLTIGNEVVSGDVVNTNASWLSQRLESLGVRVVLAAAVPDEVDAIRSEEHTSELQSRRDLVCRLLLEKKKKKTNQFKYKYH